MRTFIFFVIAIAYAYAEVSSSAQDTIIANEFESLPDGNGFKYAWETSGGSRVEAVGSVGQDSALNINGNAKYTAPGGVPVSWTFESGTQGYIAKGDFIPTPPPSPPSVLKLLDFIASQPVRSEK